LDWSVTLEERLAKETGIEQLQLCRDSFAFLYGYPINTFKRISDSMKAQENADIKSAKKPRAYDHQSYDGLVDGLGVEHLDNFFADNGIDADTEMLHAGSLGRLTGMMFTALNAFSCTI